MNLPGFYALESAWFFLLLAPLILFYFLKLKRPRLQISSLVLWRQVINDQRVNSPFQRFKRNLLLLLQILLLSLLVLAAMQPFIRSAPQRAEYLPVLIDCSASMGALDKPGGISRLDEAKARVRELIDKLLPDQRLSLIAFHLTARRLTDFTDNKRLLHQALDKLTVSQVGSRLEDALRMTQALARTEQQIGTVLMLTDGNIPAEVEFELPFEVNFQLIPPGGQNIGITGVNARRAGARSWDVFTRLESSLAGQTSARVELLQDGKSAGEESVLLEPGKSQRLVFRVEASAPTSIEVRLHPEGFDSLNTDNVVFIDLPEARPLSVYASPELSTYRHALKGLEGITLFPDENGAGSAPEYDLVISESEESTAQDAPVACYIGVVPADLQKLVHIEDGTASIVDWHRSSELLEHVQLSGIQTTDDPHSAAGVQDAAYEQLGYEILAFGRAGPLILRKRTGARLAYYFLFHTDRSTFPYRVGFPILVANLVHVGLQQASLSEVPGHQTGVLPPQSLQPNHDYRVTSPDGGHSEVKSSEAGIISGVPAQTIGQYVIANEEKELLRVGISLLDAEETSLAAAQTIEFPETTVQASETSIQNDRPLWSTLALCAFCLLLVEWWFYQRPPGGLVP